MAPELGGIFAAAMHDYPAFRYIHQDLSGVAYEDTMRLTFEYYIELEWLDGEPVLGCWDEDKLVGGMLLRRPGAIDTFDPSHPVTVEYRSKVGEAAWNRLDEFELMLDENAPRPDEGCFDIDLLAAKPESQGRGYGRAMLEYVADLARKHPTTNLVALNTESPEKHAFYEHFGYKKVSTLTIGNFKSTTFLLDTASE